MKFSLRVHGVIFGNVNFLHYFYLLNIFAGNGYIGTTTYPRSKLHIKTARTISLEVNFYPIVQINIEGLASEGMLK